MNAVYNAHDLRGKKLLCNFLMGFLSLLRSINNLWYNQLYSQPYLFYVIIINLLDVNECEQSLCDTNAMCTDTNGSYACTCNSGFSGDGDTCESMM